MWRLPVILCVSLAACGGATEPAPAYQTTPLPATIVADSVATTIFGGIRVTRNGAPSPGLPVYFCATAGAFLPPGGVTDAAGRVTVVWQVPAGASPASLRAELPGEECDRFVAAL
jgi:hypothetical protein